MVRWQVVTTIIALYLGVTLGIGLAAGRRASKSVAGYVAGDRDFGLLVMYFVIALAITAFVRTLERYFSRGLDLGRGA